SCERPIPAKRPLKRKHRLARRRPRRRTGQRTDLPSLRALRAGWRTAPGSILKALPLPCVTKAISLPPQCNGNVRPAPCGAHCWGQDPGNARMRGSVRCRRMFSMSRGLCHLEDFGVIRAEAYGDHIASAKAPRRKSLNSKFLFLQALDAHHVLHDVAVEKDIVHPARQLIFKVRTS